jgi:hypothetical protein
MNRFTLKSLVLIMMLLGLPALGVMLKGDNIQRYLEFPPVSQFIPKAGFSWIAFTVFLFFILLTISFLALICLKAIKHAKPVPSPSSFAWWGWSGCAALVIFWTLAWTRFTWMGTLQEHTFFPLWACYIVIINALTWKRTGRSLLTHQTGSFLLLFPISAGFWWFFEYLNRFVQNWSYTGVQYGPGKYFLLATLAFSTVLPAVMGTSEFIMSFGWMKEGFGFKIPFRLHHPKRIAWVVLVVAGSGLGLIGIIPDYLFPLLWVSPLVILLALKTLLGEEHILHLNLKKNQRLVIAAMLSALICGFFWEMWNYWSLIKWHYDIPLVNRFHLFEMPILGYSGYLTFGLECAMIGGGGPGRFFPEHKRLDLVFY